MIRVRLYTNESATRLVEPNKRVSRFVELLVLRDLGLSVKITTTQILLLSLREIRVSLCSRLRG